MRVVRPVSFLLAILGVVATVSHVVSALPTQSIGAWASNGALPGAPSGAATVTLADDRMLVIGGVLSDGTTTGAINVYDANLNVLVQVGELASPRSGHAAALLPDGRVIVTGGGVDFTASAEIELFDPATGISAIVASMTDARARHAAAILLDGRVLIVGGENADGVELAGAELFDLAGPSGAIGSMSTPRKGLTATALLDGQVLIAGGNDGTDDLNTAEIYHAITHTFFPATTALSVARSGHSAVLLPHNGGVLIAGGSSAEIAQVASDLFLPPVFPDPYNYGMGSFIVTGDLVEARVNGAAGGAGVDGYAALVGGGAATSEAYRFATVRTDKDDYAPGEHALITGTGWQPNSIVRLLFQEDPAVHEDYAFDVPTNGDGTFSINSWAPEEHDLNVRFYLTVSDGASRAQTTFTDSRIVNRVELTYSATTITCSVPGSCTGNLSVPPDAVISARIFVTTTPTGNNDWKSTFWRVATTVPGTTTCVNHLDHGGNNVQFNEAFSITAPHDGGTYNAYFAASNNDSCGGNLSTLFTFANSITVAATNTAPVLASIGNQSVNELAPLTFTATATDPDVPANVLTFSLDAGAPAGAAITPAGAFTWTPTEAQGPGSYPVTVRVTDNGAPAANDFETITITVHEVNVAPVLNAIGAQSVNEGSLLSFTATATDSDTPPNGLTFSLDAGAPAGAAITSGGAFTWTPTEAQGPGSYPVTVRVTDNGAPAANDFETITVTVNEANVAPVLAPVGNKTVDELTPLAFAASATDADLPANVLTFSLDAGAPAGAAITPAGAFTWTPTEAQGPGSYPVTIRVTDNGTPAANDFETITISVGEANAAPELAPVGNKTVDELMTLSFSATATDTDVPANVLTFSLDAGAPAGAAITPAGAFTWTPTEAQGPGSYPVTIRVTDNGAPAANDFETITITVGEANAAPELASVGNKTVDELMTLAFTASATDADLPANVLTFSLDAGAPAGAAITPAGAFTWTPTEAQGPGSYPVTIRVTDNGAPAANDFETITITVNEVNAAPELAPVGNKTVDELTPLSFTAMATDADLPANGLTFSLVGGPVGASINPTTGEFSWTPTEAQGPGAYTFAVRVTDNGVPNLFAEESITITVNEVNAAPELAPVGNKTVDELTPLSFTAMATDADLPANGLTFSLVSGPLGASINPTTGQFSWTPTEAQGPGAYTFAVRVTDNGVPNLFAEESITVTVNEVNAAPVLAPVGNKTVDELTPLSFTAMATDADLPANGLTFSLVSGPLGASINPTTGQFSWTPTEAQGPGAYTFAVRVTDNGVPNLFAEESITVTVDEVNAAPVLAPVGNKTVDELTPLAFTATATDADLPANVLTISLVGGPVGASINPTTGEFSWTPTEAQGPGAYTFAVRVTDNGVPNLFAEESITVTVNEVNVAPVLGGIGNYTINEQTALTFTATATDADLPANVLTFSLVSGPSGASINPTTGQFSWTPAEAQGPGAYTFAVRVTDNGVPNLFAEESITVTVNEVNVAPVLAGIENHTINEQTTLTFTATATDADLPANVLTFSLVSGPLGASINPTTGEFSWTPTEAQGPGAYTFAVRVTDNGVPNLFTEESITVTVNEVNLAPTLAPIGNKTVDELTALAFTATATDTDLPANALTFSLVSGPLGASINPTTGQFSWTPTEAQGPGAYTFAVRVTDNGVPNLFAQESITVTVNEVNLAPTLASIGPKSVLLGNTLTFTGSATDPDLPANVLSFSLGAGAPAGASITPAGVFTWTPTAAQAGVHSVTVRVTDNGVPSMSVAETITVNVQYSMCYLYDVTKSHKKGSTIPIKLYLCDTAGNNVSSPGTVLNATAVVKVDASASSAVVDDSGNANPDFNFRYTDGLGAGGGYIFNLSTKTAGYNTGTWKIVFTVNGVASTTYFAPFDIR